MSIQFSSPFSSSYKAGLVVRGSLPFLHMEKSFSLHHFWRITLLNRVFLVGSFFSFPFLFQRFLVCYKHHWLGYPNFSPNLVNFQQLFFYVTFCPLLVMFSFWNSNNSQIISSDGIPQIMQAFFTLFPLFWPGNIKLPVS